jgi:hypothetical protein
MFDNKVHIGCTWDDDMCSYDISPFIQLHNGYKGVNAWLGGLVCHTQLLLKSPKKLKIGSFFLS